MNSESRGAAVNLLDSGHRLPDKKFDDRRRRNAVVDHGLISLWRLDCYYWAICAWWLDHKQCVTSYADFVPLHRAQLLDISNILEKPSLRADFSFPRESAPPISASFPRCEEPRAIARPLLDLECKFEICLEPSDRDPVFR
jgi:hypothetical protein